MNDDAVRELLELNFHPVWHRVNKALLDRLQTGFSAWLHRQPRMEGVPISEQELRLRRLLDFLTFWIREELEQIERLRAAFAEFSHRHSHAATERERSTHIINFARRLGASEHQLRRDRKAMKRWFGYDAVAERFEHRYHEAERELVVALNRLGVLAARYLRESNSNGGSMRLWRRLQLERLLQPLLAHEGEQRIRAAAFGCLADSLRSLPHAEQEQAVDDATLRYIYRAALERRQDIWIQCEALSLLRTLSTSSLISALHHRLEHPATGDDLFVRRRAVRILAQQLSVSPGLQDLLPVVGRDPSPAVRQLIIDCLPHAERDTTAHLLTTLIEEDPEPSVRAATLLGLPALFQLEAISSLARERLRAVLESEQNRFVLRTALHVLADVHAELVQAGEESAAKELSHFFMPTLAKLHRDAKDLAVRRWSAEVRERIWVAGNPAARALENSLREQLQSLPHRGKRALKRRFIRGADEHLLGRTLSCMAQQDFDLELDRGLFRPRLRRDARLGFRTWRLVHELLRSSSDKRQGHPHTIGRIYRGDLHAPSAIMSELAETEVPGEPVFLTEESGRRPYLPLLDQVISTLDKGLFRSKPLRLYSAEGVTYVHPPHSLGGRLLARLVLTLRFERYAKLRNWRQGDRQGAAAYATALQRLGIELTFHGHQDLEDSPWSADPAVQRFFPALIPLPLQDFLEQLLDYFYSLYQNNIQQLLLFLAAAVFTMTGRHVYLNARIRRARKDTPLVIGGWGTRGKSGTERLKAALFNALGHAVVSKTTGCEAMFLHAHSHGKLREIFLFRPYDKATIWEQATLVRLARRLNADVFLWECMGLTPAYVAILQQQWMKDDVSTITNTYPDHEDLQGPAGYNIPEVMTNFIPENSLLVTTEEQMLPILRVSAQHKNTRLRTAGWIEAGLLPPDILRRFPYEEHPYNIALVLALADELGIEQDFALKEMADRVVPDLGVLKASPPADVQNRRLEFVNGMSANERFGCLGNWKRMGFADQDPYAEPQVWLSTVVNNRADRVPRSRVFADILVTDTCADSHFLIGTNLDGLQGYIREAWDEYVAQVELFSADENSFATPLANLEAAARRLRITYRPEHVRGRLWAMLQGLGLERKAEELGRLWEAPEEIHARLTQEAQAAVAEDVLRFHRRNLEAFCQFRRLAADIEEEKTDRKTLEQRFREQLWQWFRTKFTVIADPHSSGEQVLREIIRETPPGVYSRIMGLQNIKGTGLDFVYRWQAWEICHAACRSLDSEDPAAARQGLRELSSFQEYGQLSEETVRQTVERVRHKKLAQNELFQAELRVILSNLDTAMAEVRTRMEASRSIGYLARLLDLVEAFMDSGDAVRRRKRANRIYSDLASEQISHERAAIELQKLNQRQMAGWLRRRAFELAGGKGNRDTG